MAGSLYFPVFVNILMLVTLYNSFQLSSKNYLTLLKGKNETTFTLLLGVILTLIMGLRPITFAFGDTINYAREYSNLQNGFSVFNFEKGEVVFNWLMATCAKVMDVSWFFLIIEIGYVGSMLWACNRFMKKNVYIAFLFCIGAFSFFTYGTNGIRNGLSTSIIILAISYVHGTAPKKIFAVLLMVLAYNIHKSAALPIGAIIISLFYSNTKTYMLFWVGSIFISLIAGGFVENIFIGLGFDDRMDSYLVNDEYNDQFSSTGFRWDFLLYSLMPILLGYYCVVKQKVYDQKYVLLLNTYILCNAFWVMLIRASFSNRFAYLSWFLYPIVLAYPLLKLPIWRDQGKRTGWILMGHTMFTYLMWIIKG